MNQPIKKTVTKKRAPKTVAPKTIIPTEVVKPTEEEVKKLVVQYSKKNSQVGIFYNSCRKTLEPEEALQKAIEIIGFK